VEINKADAKFEGSIGSPFEGEWFYDAIEYVPCTPYNPPLAPRKKCRTTTNTGGAVVVPTVLFPAMPETDVEEMDWEPIVDEVAPPKQLSEHVQQPVEVLRPLDHEDNVTDPFCYGIEDEEEEDDGSDYYFSLRSTTGASVSAVNYFTSMGIAIGMKVEEEASITMEDLAVHELTNEEAVIAMEDLVLQELINEEAAIVMDDLVVDTVLLLECVLSTPPSTDAVLGSIWVPDPKHGLVRRSARL
jgi:hypothetical protein